MKDVVITLVAGLVSLAISWGMTVGISTVAALCFGYHLTLLQGTGIWLTLGLLKTYFCPSKVEKK